MALFTMAPAISAGLSLANANQIKNKNKLTMTAQNQAVSDKYKDDLGGYQLTGFNSPKPTSFYDTSGSSQTIELAGPPSGTMPADNNVKDYLGGLYQGAFNRDPEFNNDPSNTADYWVDAVSKGQQGDRDWKEWLAASIYGSDEKKGMASTGSDASSPSQTQQQTQQQPVQQAASSGLTLDDLNSWWDTKQGKQPDKFDQFKEFMGLMGGMGGFGGGGVPGFASGGVAAASPYNNFMGFMNAFKSLGGGSQQADISTSNIN